MPEQIELILVYISKLHASCFLFPETTCPLCVYMLCSCIHGSVPLIVFLFCFVFMYVFLVLLA